MQGNFSVCKISLLTVAAGEVGGSPEARRVHGHAISTRKCVSEAL